MASIRDLLEGWGLDDEYILAFERERFKPSTLLLVSQDTIAKIIPEEGPRIEFNAKLKLLKSDTDKKNNNNEAPEEREVIGHILENVEIEVVDTTSEQAPEVQVVSEKASGSSEPNDIGSRKRTSTNSIDLEIILKSSLIGKTILSHYSSHHNFSDSLRNKLGDAIISFHVQNDVYRRMTEADIDLYTSEVLRLFPNEVEDTWKGVVTRIREKSIGRGKILTRYYGARRVMRKNFLLLENSNNANAVSDDEVEPDNKDIEESILWLKNNSKPWKDLTEKWELTSKSRLRSYMRDGVKPHTYMNLYPALKDDSGYLLLEIDYNIKHPGTSMHLYTEWPVFSDFVLSKLPKDTVTEVEESVTPDGKKARVLLALNKLFPVVTAAKKGRNHWRPSRQESCEGLLLLVKDNAEIEKSLNERRLKYEKYGLTLVPQIVLVGDDLDFPSHHYVKIDQLIYNVETAMKAFDVTFKSMHALDTPYPRECCREWLFLQVAVYGFSTPHDKSYMDAKCSALINEYKAFKSKSSK